MSNEKGEFNPDLNENEANSPNFAEGPSLVSVPGLDQVVALDEVPEADKSNSVNISRSSIESINTELDLEIKLMKLAQAYSELFFDARTPTFTADDKQQRRPKRSYDTTAGQLGRDEESFGAYLQSIGKHPLLSAEQEVVLAEDMRDAREAIRVIIGSDNVSTAQVSDLVHSKNMDPVIRKGLQARERLLVSNLRLVVSVAKRFQGSGLDIEEVVQEGNLGLSRAVDKFDERKGFKFSTYATWWIRQAILRGIDYGGRTVRIPVHVAEDIRRVRKVQKILSSDDNGKEPSIDEIAEHTNLDPERVQEVLIIDRAELRLDAPIGEEGEQDLKDVIPDKSSEDDYEEADERMQKENYVQIIREALGEKEATIIILRFGLEGEDPQTLEQIGQVFGVTRERIRQIEEIALRRLRHVLSSSL